MEVLGIVALSRMVTRVVQVKGLCRAETVPARDLLCWYRAKVAQLERNVADFSCEGLFVLVYRTHFLRAVTVAFFLATCR